MSTAKRFVSKGREKIAVLNQGIYSELDHKKFITLNINTQVLMSEINIS